MTWAEMHEKRIAKWTESIRKAENSGLTIKKWCKDHEIIVGSGRFSLQMLKYKYPQLHVLRN